MYTEIIYIYDILTVNTLIYHSRISDIKLYSLFMRTKTQIYISSLLLWMLTFQVSPFSLTQASGDDLIYPLKTISKLECRFEEYSKLWSDCIQNLPILKSKDYEKYATQNDGYNDYTRIYTVLWGSSYKYWWDVGYGWHQGTDIATAKWTPVYAIADGEVIVANEWVAWGNHISIEHEINGKKVVSNYAHLSKMNVEEWDNVKVWDKIWEVGSTGNSSGNHLHFQIDLPQKSHPYYYDYATCPYSYNEISESGVCFDELAENTFDPLVFLETGGAVLNSKATSTPKNSSTKEPSSTQQKTSIFDTTVYYDFGTSDDVKEVQKVMKELWYYSGKINGDFEDVEESIIQYQLETKVISARSDDGAGWFGPKTRTQAKKDYIALGNEIPETKYVKNTETQNTVKTETISREKLKMTREEIEAREVQDFLNLYNIDFSSSISQIGENQTAATFIQVSSSSKGKWFKGNVPGNISFDYDETKISVFPKSFFNFTDGKREIYITGKTNGHTVLNVKIWDVIVKTFSITVGKTWVALIPTTAKIYGKESGVIGEVQRGVILMKDQYGNKMTKSAYDGTYNIVDTGDIEYCIKKGRIEDVKETYARKCRPEEYSNNLSFSYQDTIGGLLVFEYKSSSIGKYSLEIKKENQSFGTLALSIEKPKGLTQAYAYYTPVIDLLSKGVVDGVKNGYFGQDNDLTKKDAVKWIENTKLVPQEKKQALAQELETKSSSLTRKDFLELLWKYIDTEKSSAPWIDYRDIEENDEVLVASLVGSDYKWKDSFWEKYFQPKAKITRGEACYMMSEVLKNLSHSDVVLR